MSDDFDRHDDDFDWMNDDDDDNKSSSSDSTGLTGNLSWQKSKKPFSDEDSDGDEDDLDLDWVQSNTEGEPSQPSQNKTGVTGELSWLNQRSYDDDSGSSEASPFNMEDLDWLQGDDDEDPEQQSDPFDETPDWLQDAISDTSEAEEEPEPEEPAQPRGTIKRLGPRPAPEADTTDQPSDSEPGDTPPWLSNMGDTGVLSDPDAISDQPDWLANVGDTGSLNRADINRQLEEIEAEESDTQDDESDWLSDLGIDESTSDADTSSVFDTPDWLSGADSSDADDISDDMDNLFGFDTSEEEDESTGTTFESDSDWTDYSDNDFDDDYDPYAQYDDDFDEDYEDVLTTDTSEDDFADFGSTPFSEESTAEIPDDAPDWLAAYGDEFDDDDGSEAVSEDEQSDTDWFDAYDDFASDDEPVSEGEQSDTDWFDAYDDGEADDSVEESPSEPAFESDWLSEYDDDAITDDEFEDDFDPFDEAIPQSQESTSTSMDVPDWLRGEADTTDEDFELPVDEDDEFMPSFESDEPDDLSEFDDDDLLSDFELEDELPPSTDFADDLDMFGDDLELEDDLPVSSGLTGELEALGDDFALDDIDIDDLELDLDDIEIDDLDLELDDLDLDDIDTDETIELSDTDDLDALFDDAETVADDDLDALFDDAETVADDDLDALFDDAETVADDDLDALFDDAEPVAEDDLDALFDDAETVADDDLDALFDDAEPVAEDDLDALFDDADEIADGEPANELEAELLGMFENTDDADDDFSMEESDAVGDELEEEFLDLISSDEEFFSESSDDDTGELSAPDEELDLSFLDEEPEDSGTDWFEEPDVQLDDAEPDWMQTLADADIDNMDSAQADDDLADIFDDEPIDDIMTRSEVASPAPDLDSLLASFDDVDEGEFDEDTSTDIDDLDAIFDAALIDEEDVDDVPDHMPEWLRDADISSDEGSAAAIIRKQSDKPIEDLDERLQALRERALSASSSRAEGNRPENVKALQGVGDALDSPEIEYESVDISSDINLSAAQEKQAQLLQQIVGVTLSADHETDEEGVPIVSSSRRQRRIPNVGRGRLLVATLILLVMVLPFVTTFGVGSLPPTAFGRDNPNASALFNQINGLNEGDWVLVGMEYGPTAAGELDGVTDILLRHIFTQGAKPIIVSSNPIAIVHAQNILNDIDNSVQSFNLNIEANQDYYLTRYLTGGTLGLRDLTQNFQSVVNSDNKGVSTNLSLTSLDDLALMLVIAENSDDIRSWAEQVAPTTSTTLLAATGYAAQPLTEPYVNQTSGIAGLLIGYRDAYTYGEMLQGVFATPTPSPTLTFTSTPTVTNTPEPTNTPQPSDTPQPTDTPEAGENVVPVDDEPTSVPTSTPQPTDTPVPSNTPTNTPEPTNTPTDTPEPTATPRLITVIVINDDNASVNVRSGPSVNFPFLTTVNAGDVFEVIGENDDGTWINFLLPDGREGWIAAFLVQKIELPEEDLEAENTDDSADAGQGVVVLQVEYNRRMGKNGGRVIQQVPTATPELEETTSGTDSRVGFVMARSRTQERSRLNAMTLGTIAAVIIILFGNIYFGLQLMVRRRRESKR